MKGYEMFDNEALIKALKEGNVSVSFIKKDGTDRIMNCTLNMDTIPAESHPSGGSSPSNTIAVWDLDKNGWRSFRKDSITSWAIH